MVDLMVDPNTTYVVLNATLNSPILNATLTQPPSQIQTYSTIFALIISLSALVLGLFNFWWSNYRKGKIIVSDPLLYGIALGHNEPKSLSMQIPLIFLNEGGATRFIQDLGLILQQNGKESNELYFARFSSSMYCDEKGAKEDLLAQQFFIEGHKAYSGIFFFYREAGGFIPSAGVCKAKIKAKIDDEDGKFIHEFDFNIRAKQDMNALGSDYCDGREVD